MIMLDETKRKVAQPMQKAKIPETLQNRIAARKT
jgi:hypothetical protein